MPQKLTFFSTKWHFDSVTAAVVVKVSNCNLGLLFHQTWRVDY